MGYTYSYTWDASVNSPALQSSVGTEGMTYVVNVSGTTNLNGITTWARGDYAKFTGGAWTKIPADIMASQGIQTASQVLNIPKGNIASTNVQDAINELDTEKQTASSALDKVTAGTFAYADLSNKPITDLAIFAGGSSSLVLTLLGSALTFLGGDSNTKAKFDLTRFTQVRLIVQVKIIAGSASSKLIARYRTADSSTPSDFLDVGASEVSVPINVANAIVTSSWIDLVSGAKGDVFLAILTSGGSGLLSPSLGGIHLQFR